MSLRPPLRWAFGLTLVMTVAALWTTPGDERPLVETSFTPSLRPMVARAPAASTALPERIESAGFLPPARDLFAPVAPPQLPKPLAPAMAAAPASVGPPMPPPPPVLAARFVARLRTPSGEHIVYLRDGEQMVQARPGAVLSSGHVIEALVHGSVGDNAPGSAASAAGVGGEITAIRFHHPGRDHRDVLRLPSIESLPR